MPRLREAASASAAMRQNALKKEAHAEAEKRLGGERDRLKDLMSVNPSVGRKEVDEAEARLREVLGQITASELRLDAVRLVIMGRTK